MKSIVSIIIPVYNCENNIGKCIESIINQTYKNIEIITINDGSTDSTKEILNDYKKKDDRIKIINKCNEGVSVARNTGIKNAQGKYLMFVDSDDWIEPDMVKEMVDSLELNNVDVVRCNNYLDFNNGQQKISSLYELSNKKYSKDDLDKCKVIEHFLLYKNSIKNLVMLLLIKKELIMDNSIFFDESLYMMEDVYFYQKLFANLNTIFFLDKPLYHYYENISSVTQSPKKYFDNIVGILDVNEKLNRHFAKNRTFKENLLKMNANHIRIICDYLQKMCVEFEKDICLLNINTLKKHNNFLCILKSIDCSELNIKYKIQINSFFLKNAKIIYIVFKTTAIILKIMR